MPYLAWLQFLLASGSPALIKALQAFVEALMQTWPQPAGMAVVEATDQELACEVQIAQMLGGPNAAFDGARLRSDYKFLSDCGLLIPLANLQPTGKESDMAGKKDIRLEAFDGSRLRTLFAFFQLLTTLFGGFGATQQLRVGDYLKWLTWARTLGEHLPAFFVWLQEGLDLFSKIFPQPAADGGGLQMVQESEEVLAAEADVLCLLKE